MAVVAIELNDTAVSLAKGGALITQSPGFALLDGDRLSIGDDALRRARLEPRMINTRFWERLSDAPALLARANGWTHADLARAHLARVWSCAGAGVESLILVVPGDYDRRRLGLVLGVAEQLNLPVRGMVDGALVACDGQSDSDLIVHVNVLLHRTLVSGIEQSERARRVFVRSLDGYGLIRLYERWIELIGKIFVRTTRFDPLHRAESEQAIFDHLPQWLELYENRDSLDIKMAAADGSKHVIQLARDQLKACARDYYEALRAVVFEQVSDATFVLALDHVGAKLPGLAAMLTTATGGVVARLPSGAGALGALRRSAQIIEPDWQNTVTVSLARDSIVPRHSATTSQ